MSLKLIFSANNPLLFRFWGMIFTNKDIICEKCNIRVFLELLGPEFGLKRPKFDQYCRSGTKMGTLSEMTCNDLYGHIRML